MFVTAMWPFSAAAVGWQSQRGSCAITVICKVTYELRPGTSPLASSPDEVIVHDVPASRPGSIAFASELAPFKVGAEVLVAGSAHGAPGVDDSTLVARIAVHGIDRSAVAPRAVAADAVLSHAGQSPRATSAFGPLRGTSIAGWAWHVEIWDEATALELEPLDAIERSTFNVAPEEQQLVALPDEVELTLENLHPAHARLTTRLHPVTPRVRVASGDNEAVEVPTLCDTLTIDSDRGLATLVWRAMTAVPPGLVPRFAVAPHRSPASRGGGAPVLAPPIDVTLDALPLAPRRRTLPFMMVGSRPPKAGSASLQPGAPQLPATPFRQPGARAAIGLALTPASSAPPPDVHPGAPRPTPPPVLFDVEPCSLDDDVTEPVMAMRKLPLERVATLDVDRALRPASLAAQLEAHGISLAELESQRSEWLDAIATGARSGKLELQRRYDAAYLARVEELRERSVSAGEYARLVVAMERGSVRESLADHELPAGALSVLTRTFSERMAGSPSLRREIRACIQTARAN